MAIISGAQQQANSSMTRFVFEAAASSPSKPLSLESSGCKCHSAATEATRKAICSLANTVNHKDLKPSRRRVSEQRRQKNASPHKIRSGSSQLSA